MYLRGSSRSHTKRLNFGCPETIRSTAEEQLETSPGRAALPGDPSATPLPGATASTHAPARANRVVVLRITCKRCIPKLLDRVKSADKPGSVEGDHPSRRRVTVPL